jgi:ketosteroid isomerase-like protein
MKYLFPVVILSAMLCACNQHTQRPRLTPQQRAARLDSLKTDLLKTDIAFSQLSEDKVRNVAFTEYADSSATILRSYSMPISGKDTIISMLNNHPDTSFKQIWTPISADVARSGDLGYTYGTYYVETKNADKSGGTYCTVWKKDPAGKWKFILSTGNEGVKPQE